MPSICDEIRHIYEVRATKRYGLSDVDQQQHALQAATLAEANGETAAVITAALVHDIGHMIHDLGDNPAQAGIDDKHEALGAVWLEKHFGQDVTEPVRLHVPAKRYLCTVDPSYFGRLSADSVLSLDLQGGRMSAEEVKAFEADAHASAAIRLRKLDEAAKDPHMRTPPVAHFMQYVAASLRR